MIQKTVSSHHKTGTTIKNTPIIIPRKYSRKTKKSALFRSKMRHIIPEEASEDEEGGSKPGSPDNDPNKLSDDDIEDILAPQEQSQKRE